MHTAIPDIHHSVERPIIKSIMCQLRDNNIIPTWENYSYQPVLEKRNSEGKPNAFMFKSEGYMEVAADLQLTDGLNNANPLNHHFGGRLPIFMDSAVQCALQPVYNSMTAEISIKFHTTSRELILQWRNSIRQNRLLGADRWTHEIQYGYRVPGWCGDLVQHVHNAIEKKAGYGDDFSTYVHKHMIQGTKIVTGGNHMQLQVQELQTQVMGILDPELEISAGDDQYTGTITYKVWFDMPRSVISIYDVQVHQTLLPKKYLPKIVEASSNNGILTNQDRTLLEPISSRLYKPLYKEVNITPMDVSIISDPPKTYRIVWKALLTLDTGLAGEVLCNLRDIPSICMPEWMLCLIENFRKEAVLPFKMPLLFSLHRGEDLMDITYLKIDQDLNLITREDLNLRNNWHISLSVSLAPHNILYHVHEHYEEVCPGVLEYLKDLILCANEGAVRKRINVAHVNEFGICKNPGMSIYTVESVIIQTKRPGDLDHTLNKIRS